MSSSNSLFSWRRVCIACVVYIAGVVSLLLLKPEFVWDSDSKRYRRITDDGLAGIEIALLLLVMLSYLMAFMLDAALTRLVSTAAAETASTAATATAATGNAMTTGYWPRQSGGGAVAGRKMRGGGRSANGKGFNKSAPSLW